MLTMENENMECVILIQPKENKIKRRAIKECEHTISKYGKLTNFKKKSVIQTKFHCDIQKDNIPSFLKELENYFRTENKITPALKKFIETKKALDPVSFILILTMVD